MQLKTNQYTDQFSAAPGAATLKGAKQQEQEQKRISQAYRQGEAQKVSSLSQNLRNFTNSMNQVQQGISNLTGMQEQVFQEVGKNDAQNDITAHKNKIRSVENSNLSDEEKLIQIDTLNLKTKDAWGGVYAKAYNNSIEANYVNEGVIRASQIAKQAEETAKGDPEHFKKAYNSYLDEYLKGSPSAASNIAVQDAFRKQGISSYRSIYNKNDAKRKKEEKYNAGSALKTLLTQKQFYQSQGSSSSAELVQIDEQIDANLASQVQAGYMVPQQAEDTKQEIDIMSYQQGIANNFKTQFEEGKGLEYYRSFEESHKNGVFRDWKPGAYDKMNKDMKSTIKIKADSVIESSNTLLKNGKALSPEQLKETMDYLQYSTVEKQKNFKIESLTQEKLQAFNVKSTEDQPGSYTPLNKQLQLVDNTLNNTTNSSEVTLVLQRMKKRIQDKITLSKNNNLLLARNEGDIDLVTLEPGVDANVIQQRYVKGTTAQQKYGGKLDLLTPQEVQTFATFFTDNGVSDVDKVKEMQKIALGTNYNGDGFFDKLKKDKKYVIAGAGNIASSARNGETETQKTKRTTQAVSILAGKGYLDSGAIKLDSTEVKAALQETYGNVFIGMTQDDQKTLTETTKAFIAYKQMNAVTEGGILSDAKQKTTFNNDDYTDYITELNNQPGKHNGYTFFVPPGVNPGKIEDALDELDSMREFLKPMKGSQAGEEYQVIQDGRIVLQSNGTYRVINKFGEQVQTPSGQPYTIDLTQ